MMADTPEKARDAVASPMLSMAARNSLIREQFRQGLALQDLAERHHLTKGRVCQILGHYGLRYRPERQKAV